MRARGMIYGLRIVYALFSVILLLAGNVPLLAFFSPSSGMACCRDGHSCCHRKHGGASGPQWQAETCGMPGCQAFAGKQSESVHIFAAPARTTNEVFAATGDAVPFARISPASPQFSVDLFQRPPPFFL